MALGSDYNFDDINGAKKEEFLDKIAKELNRRVSTFGVTVQQFGLIGALRAPIGGRVAGWLVGRPKKVAQAA